MNRSLFKNVVLGGVLISWLVAASHVQGSKKPVTIAVFPCVDVVMVFKKFHPLVTYLQQETALDIRLTAPADLAEFEKALEDGGIDFAFQDAQTCIRFSNLFDKETLLRALTHEGKTARRGVVIVRKTSGIDSMADLKGKSVMFGPEFSSVRWFSAKLLFEKNGLDVEKDLKSYSHGQHCQDIAFNVQFGAVDAGVVCDHFLEGGFKKQSELGVNPDKLAVIGYTKSIPTRVFAAHRDIRVDIAAKVVQALLKLNRAIPAHEEILCHAELGGFQRSKGTDYDQMRMRPGTTSKE